MGNINSVKVIKETSDDSGIYLVDFNGELKVFVKNGDSVGVITCNKCVAIIRDNVKEEFLNKLTELKEVE
ncbi:MAG: hypothetical protein PHI24_13890 [Desulfitobacteriaceae bacterium]|nr:hypothetical protein [Desulfitobacteriaceae bacterium]